MDEVVHPSLIDGVRFLEVCKRHYLSRFLPDAGIEEKDRHSLVFIFGKRHMNQLMVEAAREKQGGESYESNLMQFAMA